MIVLILNIFEPPHHLLGIFPQVEARLRSDLLNNIVKELFRDLAELTFGRRDKPALGVVQKIILCVFQVKVDKWCNDVSILSEGYPLFCFCYLHFPSIGDVWFNVGA